MLFVQSNERVMVHQKYFNHLSGSHNYKEMSSVTPASLQAFLQCSCILEGRVEYSINEIPNLFCEDPLELISCKKFGLRTLVFYCTPENITGQRKMWRC